jgi:protein-S-isoprenylcysteine O-methyltransferase Ste14
MKNYLWFITIVALTGTVAAVDERFVRRGVPRPKGKKPDWGVFAVLVMVLCVAALPFYFHQTRGTRLGFWIGAGWTILIAMTGFAVLTWQLMSEMHL